MYEKYDPINMFEKNASDLARHLEGKCLELEDAKRVYKAIKGIEQQFYYTIVCTGVKQEDLE